MTFDSVEQFIAYMQQRAYEKVYIWGAGLRGESIGLLLEKSEASWTGYYDNVLQNISTLHGKPIILGKKFVNEPSATYIIAVPDYNVVKRQLSEYGVPESSMIWFPKACFWNELRDSLVRDESYSEAIKQFHNIHRGKQCVIIGNGPSLRIEDLEKIQNAGIPSFASNLIFNCFEQTSWRPDYYFSTDTRFIREVLGNQCTLDFVLGNCKYMFTRSDGCLFRLYPNFNANKLFFCKMELPECLTPEFSTDCAQIIFSGYTVVYAQLQMAVYMGFSEIYLLGLDHHYAHELNEEGTIVTDPNQLNDAVILNSPYESIAAQVYRMTKAYEAAKHYADAHDVKIYNATRGGKLEIFPRVDFDSLF